MNNRLRVSGMLLVVLVVLMLTGTSFQSAAAQQPDPAAMGVFSEPVPVAAAAAAGAAQQAGWSGWASVNMKVTSAPSVTASGASGVYLFARGERGTLVWNRWDGRAWSGAQELSGARLASAPSCASWGTSRSVNLSCFAVLEGSSALQHMYYIDGRWNGWQNLGGSVTSAPGAVSWAPGAVAAFARGSDTALWQTYYAGGRWSGWIRLDGELTSAPSCASWSETRVDCAVRGNGNNLFVKSWEAGAGKGWGAWQNLGGGVNSAPSAAAWDSGRLSIFYRGENGMLLHRYWNGSAWSAPEDLGGPISASPACASPQKGRVECYAEGIDPLFNTGGALLQRVWTR